MVKSWTNVHEFYQWTLTLTTGILDGDVNNEVIVSDFDNNVYVFEHLTNNTYKRAFQSQDLNHTLLTNRSPYRWEEFEGIDAEFQRTIAVYPNPFAAAVIVQSSKFKVQSSKLLIYDINGKVVADLTKKIKGGRVVWDTKQQAPGLYFIKATMLSKRFTKKIFLIK